MEEKNNAIFDEMQLKDDLIEKQRVEIAELKENGGCNGNCDKCNTEDDRVIPTREFDESKYNEYIGVFIGKGMAESRYGSAMMKLVEHVDGNRVSVIATNSLGAKDHIILSGSVKTCRDRAIDIIKDDFQYIEDVVKGEIKYIDGFKPRG